jgi:lipopolysaccharide transport system permease protein
MSSGFLAMPSVTYTAASCLRNPSAFLRLAAKDLFGRRTWDLAANLARRNIAASYRKSFFGYAWTVLPTVAVAAGLSLAASHQVIRFGQSTIPYTAYVLIGFVLWQTFIDALMAPLNAMSESRNILVRINVPKEALVLGKLGEILFNFGAKAILVLAMMLWYGLPFSASVLAVPLGVAAIVVLGTAVGLIIAPIGLLYDDIRRTIPLIAQFGLIITPVVFVPPASGRFAAIVAVNPLTPLIVTTRNWLTSEAALLQTQFWVVAACALTAIVFGLLGMRLVAPFAIERVSV